MAMIWLALGAVFFAHGAQKMLGWFGACGFTGYIDYPIAVRHIPWLFALLVVLAEFFSALGLIAGLCARVAAFGVGAVMVVAVAEVHIHYGFFMNWNSNKPAEGFEFFLLGLAMAIAVMLKGAGAFSLDRLLCGRLSRRSPAPGMQADARAA